MGLINAIGSGLESAATSAAAMGMDQIKSGIEEARQARLMQMQAEVKEQAAAKDRGRIAEYGKPVSTGLINGDVTMGENGLEGVNLQEQTRAATDREIQGRANAAGDTATAMAHGQEANRQEDNAEAKQRHKDQFEISKGQLDRQYRLDGAKLALQKTQGDKADAQAEKSAQNNLRQTYAIALKDARTEALKLETLAGAEMDPARKKMLDDRVKELNQEADGYKGKMVGALTGEEVPKPKGNDNGPAVRYDQSGKAWTKDASGKVVPYEAAKSDKPAAAEKKSVTEEPRATGLIGQSASSAGVEEVKVSGSDLTNKPTQWSFGGSKYSTRAAAEAARNEVIKQRKGRQMAVSSTEQTDAAGGG